MRIINKCVIHSRKTLTFRHRASCILGQAFHYSPQNAFYIFNQHRQHRGCIIPQTVTHSSAPEDG
jgi:hypothetical protein